jgi:hypothetical protein
MAAQEADLKDEREFYVWRAVLVDDVEERVSICHHCLLLAPGVTCLIR